MKTVTINRLDKYVDKEVEIKGWVYNRRSVGKIWFLILRDGTGLLQCVVVDGECDKNTFNLKETTLMSGLVKPTMVKNFRLELTSTLWNMKVEPNDAVLTFTLTDNQLTEST